MIDYQGRNQEHVTLEDGPAIYGSVEAGATVKAGVTAAVYGAVGGEVVIEAGATLMVFGSFTGHVLRSDGLLVVCGQFGPDPRSVPGRLVIHIGSLLSYTTPPRMLSPGGVEEPVVGDGDKILNLTPDAKLTCLFDHERGFFVPLDPIGS